MADYSVGKMGETLFPNGIHFSRVPLLGNAGAKIDKLIRSVASANVDDPKVPVPIEKKVIEVLGFAPTVETKAGIDFLLGGSRQANPSSAELRESILGPYVPRGEQAPFGVQPPLPEPHVLPMWAADP